MNLALSVGYHCWQVRVTRATVITQSDTPGFDPSSIRRRIVDYFSNYYMSLESRGEFGRPNRPLLMADRNWCFRCFVLCLLWCVFVFWLNDPILDEMNEIRSAYLSWKIFHIISLGSNFNLFFVLILAL